MDQATVYAHTHEFKPRVIDQRLSDQFGRCRWSRLEQYTHTHIYMYRKGKIFTH